MLLATKWCCDVNFPLSKKSAQNWVATQKLDLFWSSSTLHPILQKEMKIRKTPAPWIHKTSLDLIINKTKKLLKKFLSDQIFQKLKLKFFLLYKTENIMLFYWIKHPSDTCRQLSFRTSSLYTKITGLSYTKKAAEGCWISDKNCKKKVVLNQDSNQGPSRDQKSEIFCLELCHWAMEAFFFCWQNL